MYDTAICGHIYNSMRTICGHIYISLRAVSRWQRVGGSALILLYMCPHTTVHVSSYYYICVLILQNECPHTATHWSPLAYYTICALIMLKCVHILQHAESYWQREGGTALIPLYTCPHTNICVVILLHVSSYYSKCALIMLECVHILQHAVSYWQREGGAALSVYLLYWY